MVKNIFGGKTRIQEDGRFGRRKVLEDKNTGIREYKTLVLLAEDALPSAHKSIVLSPCLLVFLYSIILSPCLRVFFHQAQVYRLVSLSSRFLVFHHSISLSSRFLVFHRSINLVRNSLVGLDGLDVGVERDGRLLDFRPYVVGHVLRVVAHVVREDDVVAALLQ